MDNKDAINWTDVVVRMCNCAQQFLDYPLILYKKRFTSFCAAVSSVPNKSWSACTVVGTHSVITNGVGITTM